MARPSLSQQLARNGHWVRARLVPRRLLMAQARDYGAWREFKNNFRHTMQTPCPFAAQFRDPYRRFVFQGDSEFARELADTLERRAALLREALTALLAADLHPTERAALVARLSAEVPPEPFTQETKPNPAKP